MEKVPESALAVQELLRWIGYERDAAWATKLAILRLDRREDIELFGAFLAEHERHATELGQLLARRSQAPRSPGSHRSSRATRTSSVRSSTPTP